MSRIVWFNGAFVAPEEAKVPIFDRGLLFADSVYEGLGVLDGRIIDFDRHMARLGRSLGEIGMTMPLTDDAFHEMLTELARRNEMAEGFIYLQITRGVEERDYLFSDGLQPNMFAFTQPGHGNSAYGEAAAMTLGSTPDIRWARRDIKSTNLLGQVLAKRAAAAAGADEALMIDPEGYVTECGAMSFFMIDAEGRLHARPLDGNLLPGITRSTMLEVAERLGVEIVPDKVTLDDVYAAKEAFATGSSSYVQPVIAVDGNAIGDGRPGRFTLELREAYLKAVRASFRPLAD